jgi:hypothetical protein
LGIEGDGVDEVDRLIPLLLTIWDTPKKSKMRE